MSLDVLNQVWAADMAFLRDMYLLDVDFFRFVWGLLQQPKAAGPATIAVAAHAGTKVRGNHRQSKPYFVVPFVGNNMDDT